MAASTFIVLLSSLVLGARGSQTVLGSRILEAAYRTDSCKDSVLRE